MVYMGKSDYGSLKFQPEHKKNGFLMVQTIFSNFEAKIIGRWGSTLYDMFFLNGSVHAIGCFYKEI